MCLHVARASVLSRMAMPIAGGGSDNGARGDDACARVAGTAGTVHDCELSVAGRGDARDFVPRLVICMGSGADRPSETVRCEADGARTGGPAASAERGDADLSNRFGARSPLD